MSIHAKPKSRPNTNRATRTPKKGDLKFKKRVRLATTAKKIKKLRRAN